MMAHRHPWPAAILIAALALSLSPAAARADFMAAACLGKTSVCPGLTIAESENLDESLDGNEESSELRELKMAMLILLIGDVPAVNLNYSTTSYTGTGPGGSNLPGGGGPGAGDPTTPSTTPEPTAWLLGVLGSGMAGAAGVFKRNFGAGQRSARV